MPKPPAFLTVFPEMVPVPQLSNRMPSQFGAVDVTVLPETVHPFDLLARIPTDPGDVMTFIEIELAAQESRIMPYFLGDVIILEFATSLEEPLMVIP